MMNGFRGRKHKSKWSVPLKRSHSHWLSAAITYLGQKRGLKFPLLLLCSVSQHFWFVSLFSLLSCHFTPVERATIYRRPLLFLLHLLPQLSLPLPATPPPALAEWQYHLPPSRKRWTVNLWQSAVKTWHIHVLWKLGVYTHTLARVHVNTHS